MSGMRVTLEPSRHAEWADAARVHSSRLACLLPEAAIEHIGSTSIPGLPAKPVIDLLVGVGPDALSAAAATLAGSGYDLEGSTPTRASFSFPHRDARRAVIHVVAQRSRAWERRLRFRDLLRSDARLRERYLAVKREAAREHPHDWDAYTQAKNDVVADLLAETVVRVPRADLTRGREDALRRLSGAGVRLNEHARTYLGHPAAWAPLPRLPRHLPDHRPESLPERLPDDGRLAPAPGTVSVCLRTGTELGLAHGGTWAEVIAAARYRGLEACPPAVGPVLRLALLDQAEAPDAVLSAGRPPSGAIHVASEPLSGQESFPRGLYLRVVEGVPWLRGFRCDDEYVLGPECVFALLAPAA